MARVDLGTLVASIDANTRGYERAMAKMEALTVATTKRIERGTDPAAKSVDRLEGSFKKAASGALNFGAAMSGIKMAAIVSAARPAAAGISALGGAAVIAAQALAPLGGALAGLPFLLGAAGQSAITLKLGLSGVMGAMKNVSDPKKFAEALKSLSKEERSAALEMKKLYPLVKQFQQTAAKAMLPGLVDGMKSAAMNTAMFKRVLTDTGNTLGVFFSRLGKYLGSAEFAKNFEVLSQRANKFGDVAGVAFIRVFNSILKVVGAAKPLTDAMTKWAGDLGRWVEKVTDAGVASGKLTNYFNGTVLALKQWGLILKNLGVTIAKVFSAATPYAKEFMSWLVKSSDAMRSWAETNTTKFDEFFASIQAPLKEFGLLIGDVIKAFVRLGTGSDAMLGLADALRTMRLELVPALEALAAGVDPSSITNIVKLAAGIANFLNVASFEPILKLAGAFGELLTMISKVIAAVPGLGTLIATLMLIRTLSKVIAFGNLLSGFMGVGAAADKSAPKVKRFADSIKNMSKVAKIGVALAIAQIGSTIGNMGDKVNDNIDDMEGFLTTLGRTGKGVDQLGWKINGFGEVSDGFVESMERMTKPDWWDQLGQGIGQITGFNDDLTLAGKSIQGIDDALANLVNSGHVSDAEGAYNQLLTVWLKSGHTIDEFKAALPGYTRAMETSTSAVNDQRFATKTLTDAVDAMNTKFQSQLGTESAWRRSLADDGKALAELKNPLDKMKTGLDLLKPAGQDAADAFLDMAGKAQSAADAAANNGNWPKALSILETTRQSIFKQLTAWGMSKEAAWKYVNQILAVPEDVRTKAILDTKAAGTAANNLKAKLNAIDRADPVVNVRVNVIGQGKLDNLLRLISNARNGGVITRAMGGAVQGYDVGGKVTGPGGPKSDWVPAMLSNGEYVLQASAVRKIGVGNLDKMNKFANGGYIGGRSAIHETSTEKSLLAMLKKISIMQDGANSAGSTRGPVAGEAVPVAGRISSGAPLAGASSGAPIYVNIDMRGAKVDSEAVAKIEEAAKTGVNAALSKVARVGALG